MLLTEEDYKKTFISPFINVTDTAINFNADDFDEYVNTNLVSYLGKIHIDLIYENKSYRHVVFATEIKNINYIVILDIIHKTILGHYILNLNREYGLSE